jgi:hypothetical protein
MDSFYILPHKFWIVSEAVLKGGLDYITGRVDMSGEVCIIDLGRDAIHDDPIILSTWDEKTHPEEGSFVGTVFPPEYLAHDFAPDENIRVAYDHGITVRPDEYRGEYSNVEFFDVEESQRREFRQANTDSYSPVEQTRDTLYSLLN